MWYRIVLTSEGSWDGTSASIQKHFNQILMKNPGTNMALLEEYVMDDSTILYFTFGSADGGEKFAKQYGACETGSPAGKKLTLISGQVDFEL